MPLSFADSQQQIARLVAHCHTNRATFRVATYKEAQARKDLIDPFFIALGWDLHPKDTAPDYQQVIVKDMFLEMFEYRIWSPVVAEAIVADLASNPLAPGAR